MSKILSEDCGQWVGDKFNYPNSWGWNINMSSTLTELIHLAGRYVEQWASDLFIFWNCHIDNKEVLQDKEWNETWYIGFRRQGVDWSNAPWEDKENKVYQEYNHNNHFYRRIVKLSIKPDEHYKNQIIMRLEEMN